MQIGHQRAFEALGEPALDNGVDRDPIAAVSDLVRGLVDWHMRHPTVARVCQFEMSALTPERYQQIAAVRKGITDMFRVAVSRGLAAGLFDVDDVDRTLRAMLSLGVDLARWYRLDGATSPESLADAYAELALRMLGVPQTSPDSHRSNQLLSAC